MSAAKEDRSLALINSTTWLTALGRKPWILTLQQIRAWPVTTDVRKNDDK